MFVAGNKRSPHITICKQRIFIFPNLRKMQAHNFLLILAFLVLSNAIGIETNKGDFSVTGDSF
jgi:hypothetical protein